MTSARASRPPLAVVALAVVLAVTAAWWALALWPLGADTPDWIVTTREVCFGASRTGLPHAGGWLLLIGEPLGMLAVLVVVWGTELRQGLSRLHRTIPGQLLSATVVVLCGIGLMAAGRRVADANRDTAVFNPVTPLPARDDAPAPALALIDQHGGTTDLAAFRGRWALVTFAFGHCEDICPVIVDIAKRARRDAQVEHVPILVVTLDPWRDTPGRLPAIANAWTLGADDRVLSGSIEDVTAALDTWGIARSRDDRTGDVVHGSTIVVVDPEGRAAWRLDGAPHRVREALEIVAADETTPARFTSSR